MMLLPLYSHGNRTENERGAISKTKTNTEVHLFQVTIEHVTCRAPKTQGTAVLLRGHLFAVSHNRYKRPFPVVISSSGQLNQQNQLVRRPMAFECGVPSPSLRRRSTVRPVSVVAHLYGDALTASGIRSASRRLCCCRSPLFPRLLPSARGSRALRPSASCSSRKRTAWRCIPSSSRMG